MQNITPCRLQASDSSFIGSRLNGVAVMFHPSLSFVGHMQKPSWCLVVMQRYLIPALAIDFTHASASKSGASNVPTRGAYWDVGMASTSCTHSAARGVCLSRHSPPSCEYRPQWMNMPKRASRNHLMRSSFFAALS